MEAESSPKLEYNLAGGLLLTIRERDLELLTKELVSSGYRYGCVLPFRGLAKEGAIRKLQNSSLSIVHLEEAWNPTSHDFFPRAVFAGLLGYYKRFRDDTADNPPILQDAVFPSKANCDTLFKSLVQAFPQAKFISHTFEVDFPQDRLLVEINPGINKPAEKILAEAEEKGIGLVFDPSHLLAPGRIFSAAGEPAKSYKGEWERQFNTFASQVRVVDINSTIQDVNDLLGWKGMLKELAQAAKEIGKVKFLRVEIPIPVVWQIPGLNHQPGFNILREVGESLMEA